MGGTHEVGRAGGATPQKKMGVVGPEGPGAAGCPCLRQEGGQPETGPAGRKRLNTLCQESMDLL